MFVLLSTPLSFFLSVIFWHIYLSSHVYKIVDILFLLSCFCLSFLIVYLSVYAFGSFERLRICWAQRLSAGLSRRRVQQCALPHVASRWKKMTQNLSCVNKKNIEKETKKNLKKKVRRPSISSCKQSSTSISFFLFLFFIFWSFKTWNMKTRPGSYHTLVESPMRFKSVLRQNTFIY